MKVDAVILAGGDGAVIDPTCRFKGLLPVAGKPMVEWVVRALKASDRIAEVAVVVPTAEDLGSWADLVDKLVVSDGRFMENGMAGVRAFRNERRALIVTGDIPALTPEAVAEFVDRSLESGADFTYPLIPKEAMIEQFPGSERTFVKLVTGPVTGGNMMLVNPFLVEQNALIGQALFDTRKSALKMARVIGFKFVVKMALGRLDASEVEIKLGEILGGSGAAITTNQASIAADVDKPVDVVVAERVLYATSSGRKDTSEDEVGA